MRGVVTGIEADGVMARVELVVSNPTRLVALIPLAAVDELSLCPGVAATAIVAATSIEVQDERRGQRLASSDVRLLPPRLSEATRRG